MEANFFRFLSAELASTLSGRRIDKVFGPAPGAWVLAIQNTGEPLHLIFRPAKSAGHLFLSPVKPVNPQTAPAMAMWFRKRLRNRKILAAHSDWPNLRLALKLSPRTDPDGKTFLIFDCRTGMSLADDLPPSFTIEPEWPALEDVLEEPDIWRDYPHISPPLRKALAGLPVDDAHALYFGVATASTGHFHLARSGDAWSPPTVWPSGGNDEIFDTALAAARAYGERTLFPLLDMEEDKAQTIQLKRVRKKLKRNLASLDREQARLEQLAAEQVKAEALQAELYRFKNTEGLESVDVTHPALGPMTVPLNPFISPTENMERYFKLAAKAQRGFPHVERRRRELLAELARAEDGTLELHPASLPHGAPAPEGPTALPKRFRGLAVRLFRTSDGFTVIRGKNKTANHHMLSQAASPFDYWFHVEDGPSSHVILKRDHPGQDVPETSLVQAAVLCGLKSYRKDDGKADVMYALIKDVRKVKGFNLGQVAVDRKLGTLRVDLDPSLEEKLS
ncbi:NFACT RNA binding domain-containing protein [Desulfovibrio sp. Huiquan2017]|uniref:NFACT RNA binding domain-containing protein n=1 Tax=Desulfovibrio sp. Huiquan2017 TaxID=2816861 RepID=UPI001A92EED4|nr:NFACT RNA binding domain-containing protein [Desulfovibrio sp. Huiquan2017]